MKKEFSAWSPVGVEASESKLEFTVWGRKYTFDNSFLPTSITSLGEELLSAPVYMTPMFSGKKGKWENFRYRIVEKTDEAVTVITSAECENIMADCTITVEFDGFVKTELNISSAWSYNARKTPEMDGLYMDIPYSDKLRLFHYWPNDATSIIPAYNVMNSGALGNIELPFKPYVWAGNEKIGLGFFAGESDKNFQAGEDCIKVQDNNIRITFLDSMPQNWQGRDDEWCETLKPVTYTFGFHATPVKEMTYTDENYKRFHLYHVEKHEIFDTPVAERAAEAGVKWLILHEDWTFVQNYGLAEYEEKFKAFVKKCHDLGMKIMLYFGYEYSTLTPHWNLHCEEYLIKTVNGNFTGGWQRKPAQRAFMACYRGGYAEDFIKRIEFVMDEYGADGIYTDGTYVPWECANESHGCGYRDTDGKLHTSFPVLPVRELVKKLYETVHKRGGIVDTHQSSCCIMPTLSFCDSYYDGENIQRMLTDSNMDFLNEDAFKAEYMGINYGISANFISLTNNERTIAGLESMTLLYNVHTRANKFDNLEYTSKIWKIFDQLKLDSAKWIPHWENEFTSFEEEKAYTSVYKREKDFVIYAVDLKGGREITLNLPENISEITSFMTGESFKAEGGKVKLQLEAGRPNFFTVK